MLIARGTFTPGQGHEMRGGFTIKNQEGRFLMETTEDFYFDGSPDPGFALNVGIPQSASDPALRQRMVTTRFLDLPGNVVEVRGRRMEKCTPNMDCLQVA